MKPAFRRLSLHRETVRELDAWQLREAAGGSTAGICNSIQQCVVTVGTCIVTQFNTCASCITITGNPC